MPNDENRSVHQAIAADQARLRRRFLDAVPVLETAAAAAVAGSPDDLGAWRQAKVVIALPGDPGDLYPAFQFRDGQPHPTVAAILEALPPTFTAWQSALWFFAPNGWLDGERPMNKLDAPDRLVAAAHHLRAPLEF